MKAGRFQSDASSSRIRLNHDDRVHHRLLLQYGSTRDRIIDRGCCTSPSNLKAAEGWYVWKLYIHTVVV
ncbi:MAG TPA: hypothetical protein GXX37_14340 [Clostridiaceae bacterium]|nr:hypothetical protein [Clostridiaceae bacterium]